MNRTSLAKEVAKKTNLSQKQTLEVINAVIDTIRQSLIDGERVNFSGFGYFEKRHRAERAGQNPRTKEKLTIPAHECPVFKPSERLKKQVNA